MERERARLHHQWRQTLQRAPYEVELAHRRYQAVEPTHRLVAATLERDWEQALREPQQLQEAYERFQQQSPAALSEAERLRLLHLASDIPTLGHSPQTTNNDHQALVRCVLARVTVQVSPTSEYVEVTLQWRGGHATHHQLVRPVATYAQWRDFEGLLARVTALRQAGHTAVTMAAILNAAGFTPPKRAGGGHPGECSRLERGQGSEAVVHWF
jgi:hypothetical protein